jgi:hypothetical protein
MVELHRDLMIFLENCHAPAVVEPGDAMEPLRPGEYSLAISAGSVVLETWGGKRLLRRKITRIRKRGKDRLELGVERFARKAGVLTLVDTQAPSAIYVERTVARSQDLSALRGWCERLFPLWRMEQISCGADLEHSLSPRFPRAFLRSGTAGMAVMAAPDAESAAEALAFALVWYLHAQTRWTMFEVRTLALFLPEAAAVDMGLRLLALRRDLVRVRLFVAGPEGFPQERGIESWGNLDSSVASLPAAAPTDSAARALFEEVAASAPAEVVEDLQGGLHLEVHGLPVAVSQGGRLRVGLTLREARRKVSAADLRSVVNKVARIRCADSPDTNHEFYRLYPERWLESVVRRQIGEVDPLIDPSTIRRQISGSLGDHRTRTDLLALDRHGRLVIIEVKVSEDIGLPIQALDYYARASIQMERGEFAARGVFGSRALHRQEPRLLLIAPALHFHPSNETVIRFFESSIQVRQVGVAIEWRKKLRVVFDHGHPARKQGGEREWQAVSSIRSAKLSPP